MRDHMLHNYRLSIHVIYRGIYIYIHISYVYMHMELIGNRCVHVIICVRIIIGLENVLLITCTFLANPLS